MKTPAHSWWQNVPLVLVLAWPIRSCMNGHCPRCSRGRRVVAVVKSIWVVGRRRARTWAGPVAQVLALSGMTTSASPSPSSLTILRREAWPLPATTCTWAVGTVTPPGCIAAKNELVRDFRAR